MNPEELSIVRIFEGLSSEKLAACADLFQATDVLMGEKLTKEDDFGYSFVGILSGSVAVKVGDEVVNQLDAGEHFGEVALVKHQKRNATVVARESCRVAKLMTWDFEKFLAVDPVIKDRLDAVAAARINW